MKTDEVKKALISEMENEFDRIQKGINDEGEQEYYSWLYDEVSNMKDERALPFFLKLGSPTALAKYGDKGVFAIVENLNKISTCSEELASVHILAEVVQQKEQGYTAQGVVRQSVKKAMLDTLKKSKQPQQNIEWYEKRARECANVRTEIVKGLGHLAETGDADVIPVIKSIAVDDPFYVDMSKMKDHKGPEKKYLVREEAQNVIQKLRKK